MITFTANTRRATAISDDAITTRSVGIPVTLDLSEHFDGLAVTLVCKAGEVKRDVAVLDPNALEVPVECLQVAGVPLMLGLYASNSAGTIVIPTIWASAGTIRVGTERSEVSPSDPTPDWAAQVQQWAEDAHDTAERLAEQVDGWEGEIDAAVDGAESVNATVSKSGDTATISVTDRSGITHTTTVSDGADGAAGPAGPAGPQGPTGATGADGFSPTVDVQPITGGHEVTITDADGPHSFDVMDGIGGEWNAYTRTVVVPEQTITPDSSRVAVFSATASFVDGEYYVVTYDSTEYIVTAETIWTNNVVLGDAQVVWVTADTLYPFALITSGDEREGYFTTTSQHTIKVEHLEFVDGPLELTDKVDHLWGNRLMGTMGGTVASVDDAYAAPPMALTVDGKSEQASYTGKNLFNKTDYGYWAGSVGQTAKLQGASVTSYAYFRFPVSEGDVVRVAGNYTGVAQHRLAYTDGIIVEQNFSWPYTVPAGVDEVSGYFSNPLTQTNQIVTKNNSDMTYEPYVGGKPSPNPDYPQEIVSVVDPVLTFARKNLWHDAEPGYIDGYGRETSPSASLEKRMDFAPCEPSMAYTFSIVRTDSDSTESWFSIAWYKADKTLISRPIGSQAKAARNQFTFTAPAGAYYMRPSLRTFGNNDIQLEIGSTATAYEPYQSQTIQLYDGTLRSLPDGTKDTLNLSYLRPSTRAGWAWYSREVTRYVSRVDMGTLAWNYYNATEPTAKVFYFSVEGMGAARGNGNLGVAQVMCSSYVGYRGSAFGHSVPENSINLMNTYAWLAVRDDRFVRSEDFKAAVDGVLAYYPLATPTTETIDPIELPALPAPNATVWCDGGSAQPTMQMEYVRDTNLVIQAFEEALADLATS